MWNAFPEKKPEIEGPYLVFFDDEEEGEIGMEVGMWGDMPGEFMFDHGYVIPCVSHWAELPAPPFAECWEGEGGK